MNKILFQPCNDEIKVCYGVDYSDKSSLCQACPLAVTCVKMSAGLANRVNPFKVKWKLREQDSTDCETDGVSNDELYDEYRACYKTIFVNGNPDSPEEIPRFCNKLADSCTKARSTARLYMLTNMYAFSCTNPDRRFCARLLLTPRAVQRVDTYRQEIVKQYGVFDTSAFGHFADKSSFDCDLDKIMLYSETTAARWITGYVMAHGTGSFNRFFYFHETRLHPAWLATEPRYLHFITKYQAKTQAVRRLRADVHLAVHELDKAQAIKARINAINLLLPDILTSFHLRQEDIKVRASIDNSLDFWSDLGLAVQTLACYRFVADKNIDVLTPMHIHNVNC